MYRQPAGGCTGSVPGVSPHLLCRGVPLRTYYVNCFSLPTNVACKGQVFPGHHSYSSRGEEGGLGDRGVNKGNYIVQRNQRKKYTKFSVNKNWLSRSGKKWCRNFGLHKQSLWFVSRKDEHVSALQFRRNWNGTNLITTLPNLIDSFRIVLQKNSLVLILVVMVVLMISCDWVLIGVWMTISFNVPFDK